MARSPIAGSITSRPTVAVRPPAAVMAEFEALAAQWHCSLGETVLRLAMVGLADPGAAPLGERAVRVRELLAVGLADAEVISWCSREWGINRKQALSLLAQARAGELS